MPKTPIERDDSPLLRHEPCPSCGSRDNLGRYASGRGWCFGCNYWEKAADGLDRTPQPTSKRPQMFEPIAGEVLPIADTYGLTENTCRDLGIKIVNYAAKSGEERLPAKGCISFDYRTPDGVLWGQKIRYKISDKEKTYSFPHASGKPCLWLQHLWANCGDTRSLVIFEGEGDAAAYYQATGGKYAVVSVPTGAQGAKEAIRSSYEFIERFDKVVLLFDADKPGREAALATASILPAGRGFVGEVQGHKDARSALMAGDIKALVNAFFQAKEYRPDGIFSASDLVEEARKPAVVGLPWWSSTLTDWTFGRRPGELYTLGAGNSVGKTDWTTESIAYDVNTLGIKTAVIYLEQPPVETLKRLAGKIAGKPFHIPMISGGYTQADLDKALDSLSAKDNLVFGGNFSEADWPTIKSRIRYLAISKEVRVVYLDNLTALVDAENERQSVETILKELALLCQELQINIILLCHLRDAGGSGPSHEEGGQVRLSHFKGSRAMGAWPHYAFGLERNTQHSDPEMRHISTFRVLKDRHTGRSSGNTMFLRFDQATGKLLECDEPPQKDGGARGFRPLSGEDMEAFPAY